MCEESEVTQSCPTLCDPMDCSPPGSSFHGIFQARVLEWGAISFSRGSSRPRDRTRVSWIPGRCFNLWATRETSFKRRHVIKFHLYIFKMGQPKETGFPRWLSDKESAYQCRRRRRLGFDPWVGRIPWKKKWQPTPVLLPAESHGRRSLVGYSPWDHKESDRTEQLHFHFLSLTVN